MIQVPNAVGLQHDVAITVIVLSLRKSRQI